MAFDMDALDAAIDEAADAGPDMTQGVAGGAAIEPAAEGVVRLRLISYIELGIHTEKKGYEGAAPKDKELVALQFECSGPRHQPREFEGRKIPIVINVTMNLSLNEKATFFKLFAKLNHTREYKHFAKLVGKPFLGTISHNVVGEGTSKKTYANLRNKDGYTIRPPYLDVMNEETGDIESKLVTVDDPLTAPKVFIWNSPVMLKEMWDSLFIDGMYEAKKDEAGKETHPAKSKNYWQNLIRTAKNFNGSPIAELLGVDGLEPDLSVGSVEKPERDPADVEASKEAKAGAAADPLAGM